MATVTPASDPYPPGGAIGPALVDRTASKSIRGAPVDTAGTSVMSITGAALDTSGASDLGWIAGGPAVTANGSTPYPATAGAVLSVGGGSGASLDTTMGPSDEAGKD